MSVERAPGGSSLIDVLDRILDKGVVVEASVRISGAAIDLISVDSRVVVTSAETSMKYGEREGVGGRQDETEPPS